VPVVVMPVRTRCVMAGAQMARSARFGWRESAQL